MFNRRGTPVVRYSNADRVRHHVCHLHPPTLLADELREDGHGVSLLDVDSQPPGNDVIRVRNGDQDSVDCGPGVDIVFVDASEDGIFDCEEIRLPARLSFCRTWLVRVAVPPRSSLRSVRRGSGGPFG